MSIPHKHLETKPEVFSNIPSSIEKKVKSEIKNEPHSMIFEETTPLKSAQVKSITTKSSISNKPVVKPVEFSSKKTTEKKTTTQFSPGKYLASNRSNVYHEAKCEWANNINPKNRIWFQAKEDAWEKGFKSHDCVK